MTASDEIRSVCLFCGASEAAGPRCRDAARRVGTEIARHGLRLVYGGGVVGLMGVAARAAHEAGGDVLGVIPGFLTERERLFGAVETRIVPDMHTRKMIMFEESDAFVVLPGGIGTLEEIIEVLSWRRLSLHAKPIVFVEVDGFFEPLFALLRHTVERRLTPSWMLQAWRIARRPEDALPCLREMARERALAGEPPAPPAPVPPPL